MVSLSMMKKNNKRSEKNKEITMTIAVTPRAARCNGVKGNTYGEGLNVHDSRLRVYDSQDSQARISGQKSSKRFDKKADRLMAFIMKVGNFGHNREVEWSHAGKRRMALIRHKITDTIKLSRVFPVDAHKFLLNDAWEGAKGLVGG